MRNLCKIKKEVAGMPEEVFKKHFDPRENQMPYGGATDIHGEIVWVISEEEHNIIMSKIKRAFGA
jgi:hypothetical protein